MAAVHPRIPEETLSMHIATQQVDGKNAIGNALL
jgi:hypothetical protein